MGTPGLRDHLARFGVFSSSYKTHLVDAVVVNPQVHAMGNAKSPWIPVHVDGHSPVQSGKAISDYLSHVTAHQAWLRNRSPMPGLCVSNRNVSPKLIADYQMARMGMQYNGSNAFESSVNRQSAVASVGSKHKPDRKRFG